jgi:hypothetical protein
MQDFRRNVMHSVKINRLELLRIVQTNKEKHITDFNEAVEDYKRAAIKLAEANLALAQSGDVESIIKMRAAPSRPVSYEKEYGRGIRMLELSVEEVIDVAEDVFNQLVLDEWAWKNSFTATTASYKSY